MLRRHGGRSARLLLAALILACEASTACDDAERTEPPAVALTFIVTNTSIAGALDTPGGPVDITFAPGAWAVLTGDSNLLVEGEPASPALEQLAEDGDPTALREALAARPEVADAGVFSPLDTLTYDESPLLPGQSISVPIDVPPGSRLLIATMFAETNDAFVGALGLPLFATDGHPMTGDRTPDLQLFDAGTEVNEAPGAGAFQPASQPAPNTGEDEGGVVHVLEGSDDEGHVYPAVEAMIRLEVEVR